MKKWLVRLNKVTLLLTLSDIFTWGSFVVISALSGIYLAGKLGQDTVEFVGIGTGIYFITRAVFQIPIGILTDRLNKDKDEIIILAIGSILAGTPYLFYPHITEPWHYFLLQFVFGFGISLNVVNWRKLFALNIREGMEGKEYAFYDSALSTSTAIISILLGIVANISDKYFDMVMTLSGIIMLLASMWILLIFKVKNRKSR
ncbi:MAG: MFS transporter [Candidatus Dojkabacteria bacterium]|nr:MFS transporter [Candidatus Dojkabacteria bacterium]